MTNSNHSQDHHSPAPDDELAAVWSEFEERLAAHLATMVDPDELDHLIIELPDRTDETDTTPYAQFAGFAEGRMLRAELTGNHYLAAGRQLGEDAETILRALGWQGNDEDEANWFLDRPVTEARDVAAEAVRAVRHVFSIPHPQLLAYQAWGPAAEHVGALGLAATEDVPSEDAHQRHSASSDGGSLLGLTAIQPADRDDLVHLVREILRERYEAEPTLDDDGDFVVAHAGHPVWVRIPPDAPSVEVFACVARGVHSRRTAAVEVGLLNRDHRWMKWILAERDVWQTLSLPGRPFVPSHFAVLLDSFIDTLGETRGDLMYRTGTRTV